MTSIQKPQDVDMTASFVSAFAEAYQAIANDVGWGECTPDEEEFVDVMMDNVCGYMTPSVREKFFELSLNERENLARRAR